MFCRVLGCGNCAVLTYIISFNVSVMFIDESYPNIEAMVIA